MRKILLSLTLLVGFASQAIAADNYAATAGSGLTFGAKDAAGILYSRFIGCDNTTVSQCWSIDSSGRQLVTITSGSVASGAFASGSLAAGAMVDLLTMRGTVAAGTAAANSMLTGCVYNSTPITLTNGQQAAVQCSVNGYPTVTVSNTNANGQAAAASSSPVVVAKNSGTGSTVAGAAVGTAGTASAEVVTVQGVASMTPLLNNPGTAANWGLGATGAAVPANAQYMGFNSGGNLTAPSTSAPLPVNQTGPYPIGSTPYTASATGTTAATAATLAGAASVTTYICGFSIRANATAAATGNAVVSGTISGSLNFTQWTAPLASGLGVTEMIFSPCVPASAANTSVVVTSAAPGSGGVVSVSAWGYKL